MTSAGPAIKLGELEFFIVTTAALVWVTASVS